VFLFGILLTSMNLIVERYVLSDTVALLRLSVQVALPCVCKLKIRPLLWCSSAMLKGSELPLSRPVSFMRV
jgi:hypothetical protein